MAAHSYHITPEALDSLLGDDVQTQLVDSRRTVDHQAAFEPTGVFRSEYTQLVELRRSIDRGAASPSQVAALFNTIGSTIDARWEQTFVRLSDTGASSDTPTTKDRLTALHLSFGAFTSGIGEENLNGDGSLETLLTATATATQVQSLVTVSYTHLDVYKRQDSQ